MREILATLLLSALGLGLIPAIIALRKGRSFWTWWVYGAVLFFIALPHAILIEKRSR